jgi:glycosyltransferase involved in cell wall biosynthesis
MDSNKQVAIFTSSDLSTVQGSTEGYYVASNLAEEYNLNIISRHDPEIAEADYKRIPGPSPIPALLLYNLVLLPYFLYLCWRDQYDIIYTYKGFNIAPLFLATATGAKWIADFRTKPTAQAKEWSNLSGGMGTLEWLYYSILDLAYRLTLPHATAVVGLSKPLNDHLNEQFRVPQRKLYLVPLGVDSDHFHPSDLQEIPREPFDIVYMGSIVSQRNLGLCIDAIASESLEVDLRLHLVGDGPENELNELRQIAKKAAVKKTIYWHGYIDHENIPTVLDSMDVAISPLPAHDSYEISSPAKLYEYLAMGLPILCTDLRAHRNALIEEQTGFFFEPGSLPSLVDGINRISELESEEWLNIRQYAREAGKDNDWSSRIELIQKIIEKEVENS